MIKLPSGVEINSLIDDLRVFSWKASEILLHFSQILKDSNGKSNILKSDNKEKQYIPQPTLVGREDGKAEIQLKEIIEESHNEPKKW